MRVGRGRINAGLLIAGTASTVSGFLIQICYHMGHAARDARLVWGWGYSTWAWFHRISSIVLLAIVAWHLVLNRKPLLAGLKRTGAWRRQGPILFALFTIASLIALGAWGSESALTERGLVEIHDKLVLPMAVLLVLHVWARRARLVPRAPKAPSNGRPGSS